MRRVQLDSIVDFVGGGTPVRDRAEFWNGDIPWVSPKDMRAREISDSEDHITIEAVRRSATQTVPSGSVLMVVRSGILARRLPVAITRREMAINQDMKALVPRGSVLPEYLAYALESREQELLATAVKRGATVHSIDVSLLRRIEIQLPQIAEQRRIVEILDQADRLRKLRAEADAKAERILPALFVKMFGGPADKPKKWPVVCLSECLDEKPNYGTMIPGATEGEWLDLRVKNIVGSTLDLTDSKYVDLPATDVKRHSLRDGDLLLARAIGSRDHLGKCVVVHPGTNLWAFDSHLMRVRFNMKKLRPEYVWAFLNSRAGRDTFMRVTRNSAVQFNINVGEFSSIPIAVPPIELQELFGARVEELRHIGDLRSKSANALDSTFAGLLRTRFQPDSTLVSNEARS